MSYEIFCKCEIGTVKELFIENGFIRFIKCSHHQWLLQFAMKNFEPFNYTYFSTVATQIEASCLFDSYNK